MTLVLVNPSPRATAKAKRVNRNPARKAAPKGAKPMARRPRSAAQRAATARMLAARRHRNPAKRRTLHRNPSPVHHYRRRRNPSPVHHFRRRNPEAGGGLFKELMSKEGLMQIAAVAGLPTLSELIISTVYPSGTGYTRVAVKAALGMGVAYAVYKFVSKKVGMTAGLVVAGTAAAELYHAYSATPATTSGYLPQRARPTLKGYMPFTQNDPGMVRLG